MHRLTNSTIHAPMILFFFTDEFYTAEGTSEEEWKRVYDLRYCTILVPFENDDFRSGHPEMEHESLTTQTAQDKVQRVQEEQEEQSVSVMMSSTVTKTTTTTTTTTSEHVHLATPRATPGRYRSPLGFSCH